MKAPSGRTGIAVLLAAVQEAEWTGLLKYCVLIVTAVLFYLLHEKPSHAAICLRYGQTSTATTMALTDIQLHRTGTYLQGKFHSMGIQLVNSACTELANLWHHGHTHSVCRRAVKWRCRFLREEREGSEAVVILPVTHDSRVTPQFQTHC